MSRSCAWWAVVGPCGYGVGEGGGLPFRALIRRPSSPSLPYPPPAPRAAGCLPPPLPSPIHQAALALGALAAELLGDDAATAADGTSEADLHANPSAAQGKAHGAWVSRPGHVGVGALAAVLPGDDDDAPATDGAGVSPPRISSPSSGALCRHPSSSPSGPGRGGGARWADTSRRQPASAPRSFPACATSSPSPSHMRGSLLPSSMAVSSSSRHGRSSSSVRHCSSGGSPLSRARLFCSARFLRLPCFSA
ncbi:translation initiation factor IF-2 [Triticum aestivum]|uniref:translation initiation factor IF-2 n=1 Tax=Triticum aestivum TaxID=4565 RepID=UPI001D0040D1|nr:translation initiation factor IF-2-like [Triticum aestivum]